MGYKYSIDELRSMAEDLARNAIAPFTYFLMGDIGTGKTTFSQFFIRVLLIDRPLLQPSESELKAGDTEIGSGAYSSVRAPSSTGSTNQQAYSGVLRERFNRNQEITSPTFNIIHIYDTVKGPVWHVDLYRIGHPAELENLGILEAMNECICLIEWPGLVLERGKAGHYRTIEFD
ncbi:MAG: tRNA (adenosine(37)-N6)-threonylcarbamoyltransferase complex ATPase subunit type 1 TsaE [Holosporales bacterium]|nr:tRNA (adenosine(37)-N6)-threonylcarbamoyltransferase complex ATPase subunit type 1 TsaE [Holosporales bacterium]